MKQNIVGPGVNKQEHRRKRNSLAVHPCTLPSDEGETMWNDILVLDGAPPIGTVQGADVGQGSLPVSDRCDILHFEF